MDEKKDYVDLREISEGNGPPKTPEIGTDFKYSKTTYKSGGFKAAVVVLSVLLLAVVSASAIGFASLRREIRELQAMSFGWPTVHAVQEIPVPSIPPVVSIPPVPFTTPSPMTVEIIEVAPNHVHGFVPGIRVGAWNFDHIEEFAGNIESWANQLEENISFWVDDFETGFEESLIAFAEALGSINLFDNWPGGTFGHLSTWAALHDNIIIDIGTHNVRILPHDDNHLSFRSLTRGLFGSNINIADKSISIWSTNNSEIETLTVYVPYNWEGDVTIITSGDIYADDNLPPGVFINSGFVLIP